MSKRNPHAPRIRLVGGLYYAIPGAGPRKQANLALVPAINFCKRMNEKANGAKTGARS
jgi:hypothetical protein